MSWFSSINDGFLFWFFLLGFAALVVIATLITIKVKDCWERGIHVGNMVRIENNLIIPLRKKDKESLR